MSANKRRVYDDVFHNYSKITSESPVKAFYMLMKDKIKDLSLAAIIFIFKNAPIWIMPVVIGNIINIISEPGKHQESEIWINAAVLVVSLILNIPLHMQFIKYVNGSIRNMEAGLRATIIRKLQMLSIQYYKEMMTGKLQAKILRDVEQVQMLANNLVNVLLPSITTIIVALCIAASKSWMVALFYLLIAPITSVSVLLLRKEIRKRNKTFRQEIEHMTSSINEMVEMIPITRAHGLENDEISRMDHQVEKVERKGYILDRVNALFSSMSFVIMYTFQLICLLFTGYLASRGIIGVGDVVLFQTYFNQVVGQINMVLNSFPQFASGLESARSVAEIISATDVEDNKGKEKIENVEGEFEFEDVWYKYPDADEDEYILKGFDLKVKKGESIAFVGESGSGKSTLLNLIIGYFMPTKGSIRIDGHDLSEIDLQSYRKSLAVVPQNNILFNGSIKDNITYGLTEFTDEDIDRALEMANVKEFLEKLPDGVDTDVGEHGGKLSGGQRQRIAIARALIRNPQIIIFDEATSALDSVSEAHVQEAVNKMMANRTTFIVAHRLSTVKEADKIVVMRDGKCVEAGSYPELMAKKGEFYNLKKLQS